MNEGERGDVMARDLEKHGVPLKAGTAYLMARAGLIPFVRVGAKLGGIRFNPSEVIMALKKLTGKKVDGSIGQNAA
jgi:hypothetical protein